MTGATLRTGGGDSKWRSRVYAQVLTKCSAGGQTASSRVSTKPPVKYWPANQRASKPQISYHFHKRKFSLRASVPWLPKDSTLFDHGRLSCKILQESCKILLKRMHLFKRSCKILARSCKITSFKDNLFFARSLKIQFFGQKQLYMRRQPSSVRGRRKQS